MTEKVSFIGLGVMGYPMAGFLAKAGYDVTVFNRTSAKADQWTSEYGGKSATTPASAAEGCSFVFACVGNDDDLRDVTLGASGAFSALKADAVFIDHTTVSATIAEELDAAARSRSAHFLDAPVSGGQAGAENGALTCMIGGNQAIFERTSPLLETYTKMVKLMGPAGSGQKTKMVNQICIAGLVQSLSEAIYFSENVGLDTNAVLDVISKGAAQSWQMENRGSTMVDGAFDFGFAVDWMRKDLSIVQAAAADAGIVLPVTDLVDGYYKSVQEMGGGRWDTSSLIQLLRKSDT